MIWKYYNLFTPDKQAVFADENLLLVGETFDTYLVLKPFETYFPP